MSRLFTPALVGVVSLAASACPLDVAFGPDPGAPAATTPPPQPTPPQPAPPPAPPPPTPTPTPSGHLQPLSRCNDDGWCWERPATVGYDFADIDGSAVDDVWAVGQQGLVAHWDGSSWLLRELTGVDASGVHVVARDDVIVTGSWQGQWQPAAFRITGGGAVAPFSVNGEVPREVCGTGPDDLWALTSEGIAELDGDGDGATWRQTQPITDAAVTMLSCWSGAPGDRWVSAGGLELWHEAPSSTTWQQVWPPANAPVGAEPPSAGGSASDGTMFFYAYATNGMGAPEYFARVDTAGTFRFWLLGGYAQDIAGIDANHAIAVSSAGVYDFDGDAWTFEQTDGQAGNAVYAAGGVPFIADAGGTVVTRDVHGAWRASLGNLQRTQVMTLWGAPTGELFAGDVGGDLFERTGAIWARSDVGEPVSAFAGRSFDDVYAVGSWPPVLLHDDGTGFTRVTGLSDTVVNAVAVGPTASYVAGCGIDERNADGGWRNINAADDPSVPRFGGCAPLVADVAVGSPGVLFALVQSSDFLHQVWRYDGAWQRLDDDGDDPTGIAFDGEALWMVNGDPTVFRLGDDDVFVDQGAPPRPFGDGSGLGPTYRVHAFGPGHVLAYGMIGYLAELRDGVWQRHDTGMGNKQIAGAWDDGHGLTVVGASGAVLRKDR